MSPVHKNTTTDIHQRLSKIEEHLNYSDPKHKIHQENGWKSLQSLLKNYVIYMLEDEYINAIVKLTIKLAVIYYSQVRIRDGYFKRKKQIKNSKKTIELFNVIITTIFTNGRHVGFSVVIESFDKDYCWFYESFCVKIITIYLKASKKNVVVFTEMLESVELNMLGSATLSKAKCLLKIIGELSNDNKYWPYWDKNLIAKLLDLHVESIWTHNPIKNGIEYCLKRILNISDTENLLYVIEYVLDLFIEKDVPDNDLANVGFSIQLASVIFQTEFSLWTCFKYDTLKNILTLISSENQLKCIFGNETFQNIISSTGNLEHLRSPKIFFLQINYDLRISKLTYEDKEFVKRYRKELHLSFLTAVKHHNNDIKVLMQIYTSIALLIIEIPSEFTAAMLVCLIMNIQKNTLGDPNITGPASHRVHAIVIAIMSLICWITDAKMLYAYLDKILKLRAYNAPFLNPPLKDNYYYATHYVLWNKPEFFFENFEVRYALWRRFRLLNKSIEQKTGKTNHIKTQKSKMPSA